MDLKELGKKVRSMYFGSEKGEAVAMIHLFGIKYASEIIASMESKKEIPKAAGLSESYGTEIAKGVKLSKYVVANPVCGEFLFMRQPVSGKVHCNGMPINSCRVLHVAATVNITGVYAKANDASRELIHDHKHPVGLEKNGFAPKESRALAPGLGAARSQQFSECCQKVGK